MLPFTTEEAWLSRNPIGGLRPSRAVPAIPAEWKNEALAEKWKKIRTVRTVVTGALEIERKRQAHRLVAGGGPGRPRRRSGAAGRRWKARISPRSASPRRITIVAGEGPADAFRLPEVAECRVEPKLAEGTKCARSWRITTDVGSDPDYPGCFGPRCCRPARAWPLLRRLRRIDCTG